MRLVVYLTLVCVILSTTASAQCQGDFQGVMQRCMSYIQISGPQPDPSPECCNLVQKLDVECVCHNIITPQIENYISSKKVTLVAGFCGKPLPKGSQCGSYTVPS